MAAVPAEMPVKKPEEETTVATPVAPELHVPPEERSLNDVDVPAQMPDDPEIAKGKACTASSIVVRHPVADSA